MNEDRIIASVAVEQLLAMLPTEQERVMISLYYGIHEPDDYAGPWPPTFASVAQYIGKRFGDGALPESTVRYRVRVILTRWRTLITGKSL
jgi:hypothetical protein